MAECNIDDMNPEIYNYVSEKLFDVGALDVFKVPIMMKKDRPAVLFSVLYKKQNEELIEEIIFTETTTLGIRKKVIDRVCLNRKIKIVSTEYGDVSVKFAYYKGKEIKYKAEYEDCKALASKYNIPIKEIYEEVARKIRI
ncbi:Protein of unknown function DUF111 [Clostridium grantii DSM 8605]|uniref:TIGR00299 family protein n=1 Tax=Clostridium grantii DSM 8605 TaxID=1121316 RepID=A0A1M5XT36_9CLOT|nr:Protein of unknown function DUF111 [Clostridium grantii DSM 8605]